MSKLKILTWNINGRSGYGSAYAIPTFIASEITKKDDNGTVADIIILTEFVVAPGWCHLKAVLEESGYALYTSYISKKNGILIAIRKNIKGLDIESAIMSTEINANKDEKPNFLQINVEYNKKPLIIIGTRIRIDTDKKATVDEKRKFKELQIETFRDHLNSFPKKSNIICGGDFNVWNNYILADEKEGDFTVLTPRYTGDYKNPGVWSFVGENEKKNETYKALIDHFVTTKHIKADNIEYTWDFINEKNGYGKLTANDNMSKLIGYPDHAILVAEVSVD